MFEGVRLYDEVTEHVEYFRIVPHRVEIRTEGPDGEVDHAGEVEVVHQNRLDFSDEVTGNSMSLRVMPSREANKLFTRRANGHFGSAEVEQSHITLQRIEGDHDE